MIFVNSTTQTNNQPWCPSFSPSLLAPPLLRAACARPGRPPSPARWEDDKDKWRLWTTQSTQCPQSSENGWKGRGQGQQRQGRSTKMGRRGGGGEGGNRGVRCHCPRDDDTSMSLNISSIMPSLPSYHAATTMLGPTLCKSPAADDDKDDNLTSMLISGTVDTPSTAPMLPPG